DAIHLNDSLFRRVRSGDERRADLGLDSVQSFLVERYCRDFVRAGALLAEPDKARLRALNQEESKLATDFQNRLLAATKAGAVVVGDKNELDGLSDADIAAAAEAARQRKLDGKWVLSLQNTTQQPAQASLKNRAVRQRLFIASTTRAEQVRKAEYALDETQLEPYFELDRVLKDGVFFAANRLYGLTFKQRTDLPVYHPDVRVFEVFDADGTSLALWYCDYFKRDNKSGGAWEDTFVDGTGLLETRPVVFNVANFTKPAPGQPALLRFDDVKTMFHEFGHALHAMLTRVQYPRLTGTNVPTDFVEFPSQFNEHWALESTV